MITFPNHRQWLRLLTCQYSFQISKSIINSASYYYKTCLNLLFELNGHFHPIIKSRVLPVLAVYRAMLDQNIDQKSALYDLEQIFMKMYFTVQLTGIRILNRSLPNPFFVIKPLLRVMIRFSDLPAGQEVKQTTADCYAVDVHQCFIFDTLTVLNAPEVTTIFCASDDRLSEAMPKIEWRRTQTIARGGEKCDFCWCRK